MRGDPLRRLVVAKCSQWRSQIATNRKGQKDGQPRRRKHEGLQERENIVFIMGQCRCLRRVCVTYTRIHRTKYVIRTRHALKSAVNVSYKYTTRSSKNITYIIDDFTHARSSSLDDTVSARENRAVTIGGYLEFGELARSARLAFLQIFQKRVSGRRIRSGGFPEMQNLSRVNSSRPSGNEITRGSSRDRQSRSSIGKSDPPWRMRASRVLAKFGIAMRVINLCGRAYDAFHTVYHLCASTIAMISRNSRYA